LGKAGHHRLSRRDQTFGLERIHCPFRAAIAQAGRISGHNLEIDYRWADGQPDRFEKIAKDFVDRDVDVIVTAGKSAVAAAKKATKTTPIVFAAAGDPARTGLVRSLAHPGGNVTGLSNGQTDLAGKRLGLLRQAVPGLHKLRQSRQCRCPAGDGRPAKNGAQAQARSSHV
jgi:putative tryptophan/tyrosine transport system substrate-binding protein